MTSITKRPIQAEDLYQLQTLTECEISPDGKWVVFCVGRVDPKSEKKYSNLWLVSTDDGHMRQFTTGDQNDSQPRWSPDGRAIAFLSNRADEKQAQLYLIPFEGGEAQKLTDLKGNFGSCAWSPDGVVGVLTDALNGSKPSLVGLIAIWPAIEGHRKIIDSSTIK